MQEHVLVCTFWHGAVEKEPIVGCALLLTGVSCPYIALHEGL